MAPLLVNVPKAMLQIHETSPETFFKLSKALKRATSIVIAHIHHLKWPINEDELINQYKRFNKQNVYDGDTPPPHFLTLSLLIKIAGEISIARHFSKKPIWKVIGFREIEKSLNYVGMPNKDFKLFFIWLEYRTTNLVNCYWVQIERLMYELRDHNNLSKYKIAHCLDSPKKYHRQGLVVVRTLNHLVHKCEVAMTPKIMELMGNGHKNLSFQALDYPDLQLIPELSKMNSIERFYFLRWIHNRTILRLKKY